MNKIKGRLNLGEDFLMIRESAQQAPSGAFEPLDSPKAYGRDAGSRPRQEVTRPPPVKLTNLQGRQIDSKGRTLIGFTIDFDPSLMGMSNPFRDTQSQAHPACFL